MLNDPGSLPSYLREGRLIPLSKNKGKDMATLKDIRPIQHMRDMTDIK
jgi:hypothetical protein